MPHGDNGGQHGVHHSRRVLSTRTRGSNYGFGTRKRMCLTNPKRLGSHEAFVRHINGRPVRHMMVDGGDNVNIMPTTMFKKKGHREEDLK
jgi:hypothetical protein